MSVGLIDITLSIDYMLDMEFNRDFYYWILKKFVYRRMSLFPVEHRRIAIEYFTLLVFNLNELSRSNTPEQK